MQSNHFGIKQSTIIMDHTALKDYMDMKVHCVCFQSFLEKSL